MPRRRGRATGEGLDNGSKAQKAGLDAVRGDGAEAEAKMAMALCRVGEEYLAGFDKDTGLTRCLGHSPAIEAGRALDPEARGAFAAQHLAGGDEIGEKTGDQPRSLQHDRAGAAQMLTVVPECDEICQRPLVVGRRVA